jgi:hypothetical protein
MRMNLKRLGVSLILVAVAGIAVHFLFFAKGTSDAEQIRQALRESIDAGKEGRAGSVLDLLSRQFSVNDSIAPTAREIARVVRDAKPDVEIENWEPVIRGDTATLVTPVLLSLGMPFRVSLRVPEVRMEFQKENSVKWLIIPAKQWKLRRVRVPEESLREMAASSGLGN